MPPVALRLPGLRIAARTRCLRHEPGRASGAAAGNFTGSRTTFANATGRGKGDNDHHRHAAEGPFAHLREEMLIGGNRRIADLRFGGLLGDHARQQLATAPVASI